MSREQVKKVLGELAATHDGIMEKLAAISNADLEAKAVYGPREVPLRFILLQLGGHDREHGIQVAKSLQWLGNQSTEAQMIVAKAEQARGELIGLLAKIDDEDLDRIPKEGEWTIRQTLEHIVDVEKRYYAMVAKALEGK